LGRATNTNRLSYCKIDTCEEQQIPIDYLTVNSDSWEEQQIPIDYLTVNIDSVR
jgi:hypothetical protein